MRIPEELLSITEHMTKEIAEAPNALWANLRLLIDLTYESQGSAKAAASALFRSFHFFARLGFDGCQTVLKILFVQTDDRILSLAGRILILYCTVRKCFLPLASRNSGESRIAET
jgi:hypothetical protein